MSGSSLDSREAALSVAEAYECALKEAIQLSRLLNDAESVEYLSDHLGSTMKYRTLISKAFRGSGEWEAFCATELRLLKLLQIESLGKIEAILSRL
jgi:hypothetical protein